MRDNAPGGDCRYRTGSRDSPFVSVVHVMHSRMPQRGCAAEIADADDELRLEPLRATLPQSRNRGLSVLSGTFRSTVDSPTLKTSTSKPPEISGTGRLDGQ